MHEAVLLCESLFAYDSVIAFELVFVCFNLCVSVRAETDSLTREGVLRSSGQ